MVALRVCLLLLALAWVLPVLAAAVEPAATAAVEPVSTDGPEADGVDEDRDPAMTWRDEVVVTATRGQRLAREVPATVTVLGTADLEQSAGATLDDALRQVPGFSLFRRAGSRTAHPTTQGVSLRGIGPSGASRTRVLLDGVPVNDPFGGWIYWSRLPRAALERVEILHGGASDLWGSSALGGVIQLLTATPSRRSLEVTAEAGSRGEARLGIAAAGASDRFSFLADGRAFESARHHVIRADQRGAIDVPAFSEHGAFYGKLRYAPSVSSGFELRANVSDEERGNGTLLTGNETGGGYLAAGFDLVRGDASWRATLAAFDQRFENRFSAQAADRSSERPALDQFDVGSDAARADLEWTRPVGERQRLTGGFEISRTEASTQERFFFSGTVEDGRFLRRRHAGGEQRLEGLYLQDEIELGKRGLLTVSARLDRWQTSSGFRREFNLENGQVLRDDAFADRDRTEISPRLGVRLRAGSTVTVHAAAYRAFRAPTINELYRPFRVRNDITAANPDLVPETILGIEAGVAHHGRRLSASVTAFHNRLDDAVANLTLDTGPGVIAPCGFVPPAGLCRQRRNLEETRVQGLEAELSYRPTDAWRLQASYLLSDATVRRSTVVPELAGHRLPQVPEHQAVLALEHTDFSSLGGRLQLRFAGEQFEDDGNQRPLASFAVVDLTLRRALRQGLELFVAVENLFDEEIETGRTADGLTSVGAPRLVHGGLRWRLPARSTGQAQR